MTACYCQRVLPKPVASQSGAASQTQYIIYVQKFFTKNFNISPDFPTSFVQAPQHVHEPQICHEEGNTTPHCRHRYWMKAGSQHWVKAAPSGILAPRASLGLLLLGLLLQSTQGRIGEIPMPSPHSRHSSAPTPLV